MRHDPALGGIYVALGIEHCHRAYGKTPGCLDATHKYDAVTETGPSTADLKRSIFKLVQCEGTQILTKVNLTRILPVPKDR